MAITQKNITLNKQVLEIEQTDVRKSISTELSTFIDLWYLNLTSYDGNKLSIDKS